MAAANYWAEFESLRHSVKYNTIDKLKHILTGFNDQCQTVFIKSGKKQDLIDRIVHQMDSWRQANNIEKWIKAQAILRQVRTYAPSRLTGLVEVQPIQSMNTAPHGPTTVFPAAANGRYDPYAPARMPPPPVSAVSAAGVSKPTTCFEPSPFFHIDQSVSGIAECPESTSSTDRKQQSLTFTLNGGQTMKLSSTSTEAKVRDATSNDPLGPSDTQMNEISQLTFTQNDFVEIMKVLDKRLDDEGKNWRHVSKSLTLIDYLLHAGSENVVIYFKDNFYIIKTLMEFQYVDEDGKDCGANVRQKAGDISDLLSNSYRLREERRNRASMRDRMINGQLGMVKDEDLEGAGAGRSNVTPPMRNRANDKDEEEPRRANEVSQQTYAEEQARQAEESDPQRAVRLIEEEEARRDKAVEGSNASALFDDQAQLPPSASGSNNPFLFVDPSSYGTGLQPKFKSFNPYQQQAQQEAMQAEYLRQQQEWSCQQGLRAQKQTLRQQELGVVEGRGRWRSNAAAFIDNQTQPLAGTNGSSTPFTHFGSSHTTGLQSHFPPPPDLTSHIVSTKNRYIAGGGFGDVYKCRYHGSSVPVEVAVKAFRFSFTLEGNAANKSMKMLRRELGIWRRLNHGNIVPFLGIAYGFGMEGAMSLVSLWMPNESLHTFLTKYDDNLGVAHRLQFLLDVAKGLHYLHSFSIVHGDLNCNNVLLDADYTARLTDFGYASFVGNIPEALTYLQRSTSRPGALRWIAPEQIDPEETLSRTPKSDVYSFGCVALQVLSGKLPWSEVREDAAVVLRLAKGHKPARPASRPMDDSHWDLIQQCQSSIEERPTAEAVIASIRHFLIDCPPSPSLSDLFAPLRTVNSPAKSRAKTLPGFVPDSRQILQFHPTH